MVEGPRGLHPDEWESCLDLVNRVFRTSRGHAPTMAEEFPLLFARDNVGRLRVVVDGGRVICHIGVLYQAIRVGRCELPVACVGAVCTEPAHRGTGLATKTLLDAMAMMRRDGRVLLLVSGGRSLYSRQGCVPVGCRLVFRASAADLAPVSDPAVTARPRKYADLAAMRHLHAVEPIRYERTDETLCILLAAVEGHGSTTVMLDRAVEGPVGYLVVRHAGPMAWSGPGVGRVLEYGGSPSAVAGGLKAAADLLGVATLSLPVPPRDGAIIARLTGAGLTHEEDTVGGVFRVMDAAGLLARLTPWWCERLGEDAATSINAVEGEGEAAGLAVGDRLIPTPGAGAFTRLLFSGECPAGAEEGEAGEALRLLAPGLPIPLPDAGLNYV